MASITGHMILKIVKGVQKVPQDTLSSEIGLDEVDLLDEKGFSCDEYDIKTAALKASAVYADSPLSDGRTLLSGAVGNVTETIRTQLTAGTIIQLAAMLSRLGRFKQACNDYWDTFGQIEPVYIKHQIDGEPGPRFARLYDIDIDVDTPLDPSVPQRTVTIVIERESYWLGIGPGENPKKWTIENFFDGQTWSAATARLLTGADHLKYGTITNRAEQNSAESGYVTQNFIDIPATSIPGDAPALLNISVQLAVTTATETLLIGKSTKPISGNLSRVTGNNQLTQHTFNAGDANMGTDTTLAADTGAPLNRSNLQRRSVTTFATASMVNRLSWPLSPGGANGFSAAVFRGRFAIFARARVSAAATVSMKFKMIMDNGSIETTPVTLTDLGAGGTGNSTDWAIVYLGTLTAPIDNTRATVSPDGKGLLIDAANVDELTLALDASRTSGAGSLYVSDIICIPMDEGMIEIAANAALASTGVSMYAWDYDNTGYFTHGVPEEYATIAQVTTSANSENQNDIPQLAGSPIYLTPGVNNRLIFLAYVKSTKRGIYNDPSLATVRINIVPRWSGLRDV